jgi:cell wall-associated NlpC family hydrolase
VVAAVAGVTSLRELATGSGASATAATLGHPRPFDRPRRHVRPAPDLGERAARIALRVVGVPYRWGGESPRGFDCSGLVRWTYLHLGIALPHSSYELFNMGRRVPRPHMRPGDILLFDGLGHVGLYLGRGRMVHAPYSGRDVEVVRLADWYGSRLVAARRVVPA